MMVPTEGMQAVMLEAGVTAAEATAEGLPEGARVESAPEVAVRAAVVSVAARAAAAQEVVVRAAVVSGVAAAVVAAMAAEAWLVVARQGEQEVMERELAGCWSMARRGP